MQNDQWFRQTPKGNWQIVQDVVYQDLLPIIHNLGQENKSVAEIIDFLRNEVKSEASKLNIHLNENALNKVAGRWNEAILEEHLAQALQDLNQSLSNNNEYIVIRMPDAREDSTGTGEAYSPLLRLIKSTEFDTGGCFEFLKKHKSNIFFSSPDFVIAKITKEPLLSSASREFESIRGTLKASQVIGTISLKTSTRPDRRYQAMYEAEMVQAIADIGNLKWKCAFITSSPERRMDQKIYEQGITIVGLLKRDVNIRFSNATRYHISPIGLKEWLESFIY